MKAFGNFALIVALVLVAMTPSLAVQQTASQKAELAADTAFVRRVEVVMVATAIAVSKEGDQVARHDQRVVLAQLVMADSAYWAARFAVGVVADSTITASATDAALYAHVADIWNLYTVN